MNQLSTYLVALLGLLSAQAGVVQQAPQRIVETPSGCTVPTSHPSLAARVSFDVEGKYVKLAWLSLPHGRAVIDSQREATQFWPTAVAAVGPDRIVVAGKLGERGRWHTVIEEWKFATLTEAPIPLVEVGGRRTFPPFHVAVVEKRRFYSAAVVGRDVVRFIGSLRGSDRILIQFQDSKDIYTVDLEDGDSLLALSATAHPTAEVQPALSLPFVDFWSANHAVHGYVYIFGGAANTSSTDLSTLVLVDANRDGILDPGGSLLIPDTEQWAALGFADGANYLD